MSEAPIEGRHNPILSIDADGIGTLEFSDPDRSVNLLTESVMRRTAALIEEIRAHAAAGRIRALIVRSGKPGHFFAGADVAEIRSIEDPAAGEAAARLGQLVFMELESLEIPTVAAIDGICVGGGLELSLACRYRLASDAPSTRLGFPEVQLGILPAWGGTTRLPRLVGLQAALDMLLTGRRVDPAKAARTGLVHEVLPEEGFHESVYRWTLEHLARDERARTPRRSFMTRLLEDTLPGSRIVLRTARKRVMVETGGHYPAPLRILEVVGDSLGRPLGRALEIEARAAGELIASAVSKHLIHVFLLREGARTPPPEAAGGRSAEVDALGVLGAGVMGGAIAQLAARRGIQVRMKDIRAEALSSGLRHARSGFDRAVERRRMTAGERDRAMQRISATLEYEGFETLDLVIEAVVERLDVKRSVLAETESFVSDAAVIATNTSALRIDELASALRSPERFGGLHFFNPVERMPLIEVVRGSATSADTLATLHQFALGLGKTPVIVRDAPGFVVNRILGPYLNEAGHLLADGVAGPAIDAAAEEFGMPMGPLRLVDEIGIDIASHAGAALHEAFGRRLEPSQPLAALAASGRLGRKGGSGFYRYEEGEARGFDEEIYGLFERSGDAETGSIDAREIKARLILAMVNEATRVLEARVARSAADVDLAMVMGTGFPPFRGGLLRFADGLHPRAVLERLKGLEERCGRRFTPAAPLVVMARDDQGFYATFPG